MGELSDAQESVAETAEPGCFNPECAMRIFVNFEDGIWHAQGVDYDIGASAPTPEEAVELLQLVKRVELQIAVERGIEGSDLLPVYPEGISILEHCFVETFVNIEIIKAGTKTPLAFLTEAA